MRSEFIASGYVRIVFWAVLSGATTSIGLPKNKFSQFSPRPIRRSLTAVFVHFGSAAHASTYVRTYVRTHLPIPPSVPARVPYARSRWMIRGLLRAGALARRHHEVVLSAQTTVSDSFAGAGPIKMGRFTQSR